MLATTRTTPLQRAVDRARSAADRPALVTLVISALTFLLALVNVTHVSMWVDEAYTISVATRSPGDLWRMVHNIDIVHSLYNLALHPWLSLTGISELSVRLPSAIASAVAAAGVVVLTRQLASPRAALAAGLVFAILPRVSWMGIEGRSYATTAALAVWLTVLFVRLCRRPSTLGYVAYAVGSAVAGSLNIFLVLLLGAHGVTMLLDRRLRFSRAFWVWLAAAVVGLAGAAPVLLTAVGQAGQIGPTRLGVLGYARSVLVNQWFLGDTPTIYLSGGGSLGDGPGSTLWKPASVLLAAGCWLLVAWAVLRRDADEPKPAPGFRPLLISWLALPTVALVGYAVLATPIYNPRYLTFGAPAMAALIGIGLVKLRLLPPAWRWLRVLAVVLIIALAVPVYTSQRTVYAKSGADWKMIAAFVRDHPGPDRAAYFAPRRPPVNGVVGPTGRTVQTLYPDAFNGVRDLTLLSTPAQSADLLGRSALLSDSGDRLATARTVFAIWRKDYPSDARGAEEAILINAGFHRGEAWTGPLDVVVEYSR